MSAASDISNGALERSPETAARTGMGIASLAAVAPADLAPLLRGEARACDGAALVLARRLGLPPLGVLAALPQARALARQNAGA